MSRRASAQPEPVAASLRHVWAARLDVAAFFAVLLVVAMRPLLGETYYSGLDTIARAARAVGDPTPATTAWLDFGIWASAVVAAVASLLQRRRWRLTGIELGGLILVVAVVISTWVAGNKRLALNASANWLTALVLVSVVANLCRDRMRIGLLLAALAASGMATVTKSGMQVFVEYPETLQHYQENKSQFWAAQNLPLDDSRVQLYERRLRAAEAGGFFALSNTNGAWLSLAGFAFLALRGMVWRKPWASHLLFVPAVLAFAGIYFTGSKGAMMAAGIGLALWLLLVRYQLALQESWKFVLLAGWVILAGLASGAVIYGVARGGLPGDSLQFRWNYWQVTRDIIEQHGTTGVGALNFDSAYLEAKPVEYPEEIRDPHNFILSVVAQWGVLGGVGLLAVFLGTSLVAARTWGTRSPTETPPPVYDPQAKYLSLQWVVAVAIGFVLLRIWLLSGWLSQADGGAYVFFDIGLYGVIWILVFAGICWIARGGWTADLDMCQVACLAGGLAFLLHNLIDLAMFSPGTLMPFAAIAAILVTDKPRGIGAEPIASRPAVPLVLTGIGMILLAAFVLIPVTWKNGLLRAARFEAATALEQVALLERASAVDVFDSTPPYELAMAFAGQGQLTQSEHWLNEAIRRDPVQISLYRARASLLEASFRETDSMTDLIGAVGAARQVVRMYPASPDDHVFLADMLARNAAAAGHASVEEAIVHYGLALELDAARPETEIRRWPAGRREAVEARLAQLLEMAGSQPADEATASTSAPS